MAGPLSSPEDGATHPRTLRGQRDTRGPSSCRDRQTRTYTAPSATWGRHWSQRTTARASRGSDRAPHPVGSLGPHRAPRGAHRPPPPPRAGDRGAARLRRVSQRGRQLVCGRVGECSGPPGPGGRTPSRGSDAPAELLTGDGAAPVARVGLGSVHGQRCELGVRPLGFGRELMTSRAQTTPKRAVLTRRSRCAPPAAAGPRRVALQWPEQACPYPGCCAASPHAGRWGHRQFPAPRQLVSHPEAPLLQGSGLKPVFPRRAAEKSMCPEPASGTCCKHAGRGAADPSLRG